MRIVDGAVTAQVTFALADVETLAALDADSDGRVTAEEFERARPRLDALAPQALEVRRGGQLSAPREADAVLGEGDAVHFRLAYDAAPGAQLSLRSGLLARLPRGHRQYLSLRGAGGEELAGRVLDAGADSFEAAAPAGGAEPQTFGRFFLLGVEHIMTGYDHLAFLLALLLAGGGFASVAKIVTSFTAAHSITLALAALDVVSLPPSIAEPLIAASIVYVGLENVFRRETPGRWRLTFAFGLVHGFGFATVLRELGLGASGGGVATPLIAFNLGVELGQLAAVCVVLPLVWKLRARAPLAPRLAAACSLLVALAGGYWLLERIVLR